MSRYTPPPQETVSHLFYQPPVAIVVLRMFWREKNRRKLGGGVLPWKSKRCRGKISFQKRIALHRGVAATLTRIALHCWAMFRKPQPLPVSEKVRQYTSNLYGSTPPICTALLSWLLSFEERETLQYTSHLYCSTPPICTAVRPPFVRQYFWKNTGGWGHRNFSELCH